MTRVLVTGGTGTLGRQVVRRLRDTTYHVRILSRRQPRDPLTMGVEWVQANLADRSGLAEATLNVDIVVHCATNPLRLGGRVDVEGTAALLEHARLVSLAHFVYPSIVGVDRIPLPYYKWKLAAERLVTESGVPWSILRATQFHPLIDLFLSPCRRLPVVLLPTDFQFQPVDAGEVADRIVACVVAGPSTRLPDLGGPEVHTLATLTRIWMEVLRLHRPLIRIPLPGQIASGFRQGLNTSPDTPRASLRWEDWLHRKYQAWQAIPRTH